MGKQSSRIFYQGKDHKDIYFRGKYHGKMYKNGQLLWEKLFPDEYFVLKGVNQGVGVLCKTPYFYDMLPSAYSINIIGNIGQTLIGYCVSDVETSDMIFSADYGKTWKKFDISVNGHSEYITEYFTPNNHSFAFVDNDGAWSIARFDGDGNFINSLQTDFKFIANTGEYSYGIVKGFAEVYSFYRSEGSNKDRKIHIRNIDQDGNDIGGKTYLVGDSFNIGNDYPVQGLWHAGTTIYGILGGDSANYAYTTIIKLDDVSGHIAQIVLDRYRFYAVRLIYSDQSKTVIESICRNRTSNQATIARIDVFTANSHQLSYILEDGLVLVKSKDGNEYANVCLTNFMTRSDVYTALPASKGSCMYVKNDRMSTDESNGICFYSDMYINSGTESKRAIVYFDNVYLNESGGNYYDLIY